MVVKGGMGTVTQELARVARNAGAKIETGRWASSQLRSVRDAYSIQRSEFSDQLTHRNCDGFMGCRPVARVNMTDGAASGVTLEDGCTLPASAVVVNADPFRLQQLVGPPHLPPHVTAHQAMDGCVLKVRPLVSCHTWLACTRSFRLV